MPSRFESDLVGSSWDVLSSVHGEAMSYSNKGGAPASVTGIFTPAEVGPDPGIEGQEVALGRVELHAPDAATPDESDKLTVRGVVYGVKSFELTALGVVFELAHLRQAVTGGDATHIEPTG